MDFRRIFLDHTVTVTLYSIYIILGHRTAG